MTTPTTGAQPAGHLLAVVIPAYNVGPYIGICLSSVLEQSAGLPVEVIVVVDGAQDDTLDVAKATIAKYPRACASVIVQSNQGLSAARNTGVRASSSRYLVFLDGDDVWLPGFVQSILPILAEGSADLIEFDAALIDERGATIGSLKISSAAAGETRTTDRAEFLETFRCYAWARVYASEIFDRISFPAGKRFEDTATIPWAYWQARSILSMGRALVGYRQRAGSILSNPTASDIDDILWGAESAAGMLRTTNDDYWRHVATRAFQQACSRTAAMPASSWPEHAAAIRDRAPLELQQGAGLARKVQLRNTLAYICMLYLKRLSIDKLRRSLSDRRHPK